MLAAQVRKRYLSTILFTYSSGVTRPILPTLSWNSLPVGLHFQRVHYSTGPSGKFRRSWR